MKTDVEAIEQRAREIFRKSKTSLPELIELGTASNRANRLDDARRLFEKALFDYSSDADAETRTKLLRNLILCTYKDPDLPVDTRLQQAEQMLSAVLGEAPRPKTDSPQPLILGLANSLDAFPKLKQDLLGIAGAVQKRRWEVYGLRVHLIQSYKYYLRGYEMGSDQDRGYNAINLAFVLDLLAEQEKDELGGGRAPREMALRVRNELVALLGPLSDMDTRGDEARQERQDLLQDWWVLVTLGEAWLGIGDYSAAAEWMGKAADGKRRCNLSRTSRNTLRPGSLRLQLDRSPNSRISRRSGIVYLHRSWRLPGRGWRSRLCWGTTIRPPSHSFGARSD
jgi:hypothetical protein